MARDIRNKIRELVEYLNRHGWAGIQAPNGHWRITGPKGQVLSLPFSPRDPRAVLNARSRLRRAGAPTPPR